MKPTPVIIDARGHRCPVPTLKLRRQMQGTTPTDRVVLWADDPMAQIDVPHFCNQNSYIVDSIQAVDDMWIFEIRRAD